MLKFYKFECAGNDFVVIDRRFNEIENLGETASKILDRRFSVGGDSLLVLENSEVATVKMRIIEKDKSESSMCGNGLRCIGLYFDRFFNKLNITVETLSGIKQVNKIKDNYFEANLGKMLPLDDFVKSSSGSIFLKINLYGLDLHIVNSSEPHAIIFSDQINRIQKTKALKIIKNAEIFPKGINVDFVKIIDKNTITIRTIERGVLEETLSCGTGAVASAYIFNRVSGGSDIVTVHTRGGTLNVKLRESGNLLSGPARLVFEGVLYEL